jgi:hypothetical protein
MALKDLLVYVDQTEGADVRLRLAADLASRHGSRLIALFVWEWNAAQLEERSKAEIGLVSAEGIDGLHRHIEASISGTAGRLRSALDTLGRERGLATEWRSVDGPAATVVAQHARYADLCILGQQGAEDNSVDYTFSEELLFVTGRPVLFIPSVPLGKTLGRHIAVAWNSSRPAARAVNDAMPLIEQTERTRCSRSIRKSSSTTMARYRRTKWSNTSGAMARPLIWSVSNIFRHGRSPMRYRSKPAISAPTFWSPARSAIQDFGKNCWAGSPAICSTA